jgi:gliding motility-associated-like protein
LSTDPVVAYFCEGENIVDVTFRDNSTFNCNINIEPDNPNRYFRWVQFLYSTYHQGGDRIPNVTVRDGSGTTHTMTDNSGNFVGSLVGPIIKIPIPADGPNQISFPISAPPGGIAGDIFEITMRNWNVCNPYDNLPTDAFPPSDLTNGDNPPIITTARIEIIAPPPVVVSSLFEFCTSESVILHATAGTAQVNWYSDAGLTNLVYTGNNFNPLLPPFSLNNTIPGTYTFYVTSQSGICESAPSTVQLKIYQRPGSVNAGVDKTICSDSIQLHASVPTAGTGLWTTTGTSAIVNNSQPVTWVKNLSHGINRFRWTVTNGPCSESDEVLIISDRQPSPAFAGLDQNICDPGNMVLSANPPDLMGKGHWLVITGTGTVSDTSLPNAQLISPSVGNNMLIWRVSSRFGACPVTLDTVKYFIDKSPGTAFAGNNFRVCQINTLQLKADPAINGGTGKWTILEGTSVLNNPNDPESLVNNLSVGNNRFLWTLTSKFGICPGSSDTLLIIRDLSPGIANAGADKSYCLLSSDTLHGNPPITGVGQWQVLENPSASAPVFNPDKNSPSAVFSVLPGNEGLYKLQWTLQNGSCISRDTVTMDFGIPPPPGFAGPDSSICGTAIELKGNHFNQGRGEWRQISGSGIANFSPNKGIENPLVTIPMGKEGSYDFEWRLMSGACAPSADTVKISFLSIPANPITNGDESCGSDSLTLSATIPGINTISKWFDNLTSTTVISEQTIFNTPLLLTSHNYYVSSYDTITGCESPRQLAKASIYPIPSIPVIHGNPLCGSGLATVHGSVLLPAHTIQWTSDPKGTNILDESLTLTHLISVNTTFWAFSKDTIHDCISKADSVEIIVHPSVPNPIVQNESSCGPSDFMLNTLKSSPFHVIRWYNSPTNPTEFHIADSLYLNVTDSSRSFWVAEWNDSTGCSSPRIKITADIKPVPAIPSINDTSSCGPANFVLNPQNNINSTTFRWYNLPVGGTMIKQSDSLITGLLSANSSYWISGYNSVTHCEGSRNQVDISIFPKPAPILINGPTLVLKNQSGVIFSANGQTGSVYNWTLPSGIVLDQDMNDFIRLSFPNTGSYNLTVFETTSHGCPGLPVSHPVTVISDSIAVDLGTFSQNACTGTDFEIKPYLFGGTPPYIYSWTGDIAYLSNTQSLFTTFSPPGTGTYHLYIEVLDVNLHKTRDSVEITVYPSPQANILTKDAIICVGNTLPLQVQTSGNSAQSHFWSGPIQNLSAYNIKEPVYTPHQPDTVNYFYTLTDVNGCKAYDSTTLYSDIPAAYFEITTEPACSPLQVEFNNLSQRAVGNRWDFGDGNISAMISPAHLYINQSSEIKYYPVSLEVTSILGCKNKMTQYAMVWPNPVASIESIIDNSCSPSNIRLYTTPGNTKYYWDYGDGQKEQTTSFNTSHIFQTINFSDTVYKAKVITESSLHCIDSAFLNLNVYASPDAAFSITPESDTFPDKHFNVDNKTLGNRWNYQWIPGDGRIIQVPEPGNFEYQSPGTYNVTLIASSSHCSDSISKTVFLKPAPPVAKFAGVEPGCMPHTINLINNSEYADNYLWEFGDGSISTAKEPSYTYYQPGIYRVKLTIKGDGGEASYSDTARVYIIPNSFFDLAPRYVYVNDAAVNFFNLSENADIFEWDFGDGTTSTELNPKHIYMEEGTFDITLKVWTENNCFDLYVMENAVFVEPSGKVEFPNAFRPASPLEENKIFKPGIIDHVASYHLMIFNRWGELIFESSDQEIGWDGTYKGETAKQDVYIWKVKGTYTDGKGFTKTGDVTLMY